MSSILGIFNLDGRLPDAAAVRRMSGAMASRGADRVEAWRDEAAVLGVARNDWELGEGFSGRVGVHVEGGYAVAADASLYHRRDLVSAIEKAGGRIAGTTPSHLIAAAYAVWGADCVHHLEGDFAFVLWDAAAKRVLCARDNLGNRPLFYAQAGSTLVVASSLAALLACPGVSSELNLVVVAEMAGGVIGSCEETVYRGAMTLLAGARLEREGARAPIVERFWEPPRIADAGGPPFEEAAEHLLSLLSAAVEERLTPGGPTAIGLSGGWDSTAVYGAGEKLLRDRGAGEHLLPISWSFPVGDTGREDELIESVTGMWGASPVWIDSTRVPMFSDAERQAAERAEPFAHTFAALNRELVARAADAGARVVLDGIGGDAIFQVGERYLVDLFWGGRWSELRREWVGKGFGGSGVRGLFGLAIEPKLPDGLLRLFNRTRFDPMAGRLEPPSSPWLDAAFASREDLPGRALRREPRSAYRAMADQEMHYMLTDPFVGRVQATLASIGLEAGVERRSPLMDQRVVAFAATRPRWERNRGRERKLLLRRSMRGLLPEHVLEPRRTKTGTTLGYFDREMRVRYGRLVSEAFRAPVLEELGLVDGRALRRAWADMLRVGDTGYGLFLYFALETELWLRARLGARSALRTAA